MRNSILGMASHDLSNAKTTILGATPGAILGIDGHPHERFSLAPAFSERLFKNWGGPRAQELSSVAHSDAAWGARHSQVLIRDLGMAWCSADIVSDPKMLDLIYKYGIST